MYGGNGQLGEIIGVADQARYSRQAVTHFERRLLSERAEHHLLRRGFAEKKQIQGSQYDAVGFAGPRPRSDQERSVEVADDLSLGVVKIGIVLENGRRDDGRRLVHYRVGSITAPR